MMKMSGTLYLVATPIGNLGDISTRASETLRTVDFIAAEDTRVTRKLLAHLDIKRPMVSYYEHNRNESGEKILSRIISGENCALVTDAGHPGISDPGECLVALCAASGVTVTAIPGPCAAVTALSLSALPSGRFTFEGFLSTARKSRFEHLASLKSETRTMIFYEAPHKLIRTLDDMLAAFGDRRISISRELTKLHEETLYTTFSKAAIHFNENLPRGDFVLVIDGAEPATEDSTAFEDAITAAVGHINDGLSVKDAVKWVSDEMDVSKNALYSAVISLRGKSQTSHE